MTRRASTPVCNTVIDIEDAEKALQPEYKFTYCPNSYMEAMMGCHYFKLSDNPNNPFACKAKIKIAYWSQQKKTTDSTELFLNEIATQVLKRTALCVIRCNAKSYASLNSYLPKSTLIISIIDLDAQGTQMLPILKSLKHRIHPDSLFLFFSNQLEARHCAMECMETIGNTTTCFFYPKNQMVAETISHLLTTNLDQLLKSGTLKDCDFISPFKRSPQTQPPAIKQSTTLFPIKTKKNKPKQFGCSIT